MGNWKREAECHEDRVSDLGQQMVLFWVSEMPELVSRDPHPSTAGYPMWQAELGRTRPDALPAARSAWSSPCCPTHHPAAASPSTSFHSFIILPLAPSALHPCSFEFFRAKSNTRITFPFHSQSSSRQTHPLLSILSSLLFLFAPLLSPSVHVFFSRCSQST